MEIKRPVRAEQDPNEEHGYWRVVDVDGSPVLSLCEQRIATEIVDALNAQADYPNTDAARWHDVLERFENLMESVRDAQIKAMRVVVDALELKMKRMLEAGSAPGAASVLDELLSVAATDEQLLALLDESEGEW